MLSCSLNFTGEVEVVAAFRSRFILLLSDRREREKKDQSDFVSFVLLLLLLLVLRQVACPMSGEAANSVYFLATNDPDRRQMKSVSQTLR